MKKYVVKYSYCNGMLKGIKEFDSQEEAEDFGVDPLSNSLREFNLSVQIIDSLITAVDSCDYIIVIEETYAVAGRRPIRNYERAK